MHVELYIKVYTIRIVDVLYKVNIRSLCSFLYYFVGFLPFAPPPSTLSSGLLASYYSCTASIRFFVPPASKIELSESL